MNTYIDRIPNLTSYQLRYDLKNFRVAAWLSDLHQVEGDDKLAERQVRAVERELKIRAQELSGSKLSPTEIHALT